MQKKEQKKVAWQVPPQLCNQVMCSLLYSHAAVTWARSQSSMYQEVTGLIEHLYSMWFQVGIRGPFSGPHFEQLQARLPEVCTEC